MKSPHTNRSTRIKPSFIASLSRSLALATLGAMGLTSAQAATSWVPISNGSTDGTNWMLGDNWDSFVVPTALEDLTFAASEKMGPILLNGNQTANSLTFNDNYTVGAAGVTDLLTNTTGNVSVNVGNFVTMHNRVGGQNGIILNGGGTLHLTNTLSPFNGGITVDNGSTLLHRGEGVANQYAGANALFENPRFDQVTLGYNTAVRNITLQNGGIYKVIGSGANPEGNYKNIIIGTGGGTYNIAAGFMLHGLDDVGQITATTNTFTKAGAGRLNLVGNLANANPLGGIVNVNDGMLDSSNQASQAVGANTYVRFTGIAGTGTTLNINSGGVFMGNNGTVAILDTPTINLNGGILAFNGQNHIVGFATATAGAAQVMNISGTSTILARDLFGPQTARNIFVHSQLDGNGTLEIRGSTGAGNTPRIVLQRAVPAANFNGTFRLVENTSLEANPRNNGTVSGGTGAAVDMGKLLASGDVEFAGWQGTLDIRDSNSAAASVLDYTGNNISVTTTQNGALNFISTVRATAATGTGHMFNFGSLSLGNHRIGVTGNNSYHSAFSGTANITGSAAIEMRGDAASLVFTNAAAISEDATGRTLRFIKTGQGNTAARDVIVGGAISMSNLNLDTGTLQLRGASGVIGAGFGGNPTSVIVNGGANAGGTNALPSQGLLHLDSNTGHVVGANTVFAAANNNDRFSDTATLNLRSNGIVRLTSANNIGTTETITTSSVSGHGTFDVVKTGTAATPVALTLSTLTLGTNATANFTGTGLGTTGNNSSRIVVPGTATGFLGSQYHSGNEWAKYDSTVDSGFELGATGFAAGDYNATNTLENTWAAGQQVKESLATLQTLTGDRVADRFNFQTITTANLTMNLAGFKLTADQGGIIVAGLAMGFKDGATGAAPSGTAGLTAGTTASAASLFFHANQTTELHLPITDNTAGGAVTFVKSGPGAVILSHQDRAVGAAQLTTGNPYTSPTWSSSHTGGWVINDGVLNVHRGQYLGATPTTVTLNGGQLELNHPVSNANADSILPGWGHHIIINGNATVGADDNGESNDGTTGDRTLAPLGSLTINNNSTMGVGAFSEIDILYAGGTTINGRATLNVLRGSNNVSTILGGVVSGDGFDVTGYNAAAGTIALGANAADTTNNTFNSNLRLYAGVVRLNKANTFTAIPDTADSEDVIINGGALVWGPGHYGDLSTTNSINLTNNGAGSGIMPTSPTAIKNAGMNQIADTANITLLFGTLGEADRINNETFGNLVQKNGTLNVGLGTIEVASATVSGGAFGIDRGGKFKAGTLTLLPGAYDPNITTGLPVPGQVTTLETGAGGLSLSGASIILGTGSSGNVQGAGAVLKLGGDVTYTGTDLVGGAYGRRGIYINTGSFRLLNSGNQIDLTGGNRTFTVDGDSNFTVTVPMTNGGITKAGNGGLILEQYMASTFTGAVTVNAGTLHARGDGAFGTSTGGVTINSGGTVKLDSGWSYGDDFTVSGAGASVAGDVNVLEGGALIAENAGSTITGAFAISGGATLAGSAQLDSSVTPGAGGAAFRLGRLNIASAAGITGTGGLTLAGNGDGLILNGVNTTGSGGVTKVGAGIWTLAGAGTYTGETNINAGILRITNGAALGTGGVTKVSGGTLEVSGGITSAEALNLNGTGIGVQGGAVVNASGANTLSGGVALGVAGATVRSDAGSLTLGGNITGSTGLTLSGAGNGTTTGTIATGAGSGATALAKNGTGTWTLANIASLNGATSVNGGTLAISAGGAVLDAISPIHFNGGNLTNTGAAQTAFSANLNAGNAGIAGGAGVSLGAITRALGATASFGGTVTTTNANTNDILGGYATVGSDWATVSGGNVVALGSYTALTAAGGTDNAILGASTTLLASPTVNSLKISEGAGILGGASNIIVNSGGILSAAGYAGINGTGIVSGATAGDELIFNTPSGTLDVSASVIGATGTGSITKSGNGTLVLRNTGNTFTGAINVNQGTLAITASAALGTHPVAGRGLNLNGGTFAVVGGDYDLAINTFQVNVGPAGGTVRSVLGSQISINDGNTTGLSPTQFAGSGDLTLAGGGRYTFSGGVPQFIGFTGNTTVDGGILTVGHSNALGGRQEQTLTLKSGSAIINNTGFALGQNGLPNNIIAETGTEFYSLGGGRAFGGDIKFGGNHTIALVERDNHAQERPMYLNGRLSGTGVTLNVHGANNGAQLYIANGANDLTGTVNLKPNTLLEVRSPGSLGQNAGDVTVNMEANSRLVLRHWQNADYKANVVTSGNIEINSDRLTGNGGGSLQFLSVNNLTVNGAEPILTINGGTNYWTRVAGTTSLNGTSNNVLQVNSSDLLLENGITFGTPGSTLQKRGGFSVMQRGPSNHTGEFIHHQSFYVLQDGGTMASVGSIKLRGGELRLDNSTVANTDRLNDAAPISLGGGTLRITGAETLGTVTASSGTTIVVNNPTSDTVASALTLTGFNRQTGSIVQFQSPDLGVGTVGAGTFGQSRVSSRIIIPGQANTTQTIPGFVGNNAVDFIQYDGTTTDSGAVLGVRDMRNPNSGAAFATNYSDNTAETGWNDTIIFRHTNPTDNTALTTTLTANRSVDAMKIESGGTNRDYVIAMGAFNLRIEGGGILDVGNGTHDLNITGTTGVLTAGPATLGVGTAELILGGTTGGAAFNVGAIIGNNGTQAVALVKTGTNTISVNGNNTFTGGTYINTGTLNTTNVSGFGTAPSTINLAGGTLQFNIANAATVGDLGVPDHTVNVLANSTIILDNGALAGVDNDITVGSLNINGPYTLSMRSFDSIDMSFTGTHSFAGTPMLDMIQAAGGGNGTGFFTLNGAITGSGFQVGSSGGTNDVTSILQIGGGAADTAANTYTGKVSLLYGISSVGANSEDMRVELNKAAGTNAITGDIEINGGILRNIAPHQIADTSNMVINQGSYDGFNQSETIASVTMTGGNFRTSSIAATGSTVRVTGDFNATGLDDLTGSADGVAVNSNTTLQIDGTLRLNGYSRGTLGAAAATLNLNGPLEMTGTTILQNSGAGANIVRISGGVTSKMSSNPARLGASTDSDTFLELNGTQTFNAEDGSAGLDLVVSTVVRDSTSPVATGNLIKNGAGVMQIEGGGTANSYTGTTTVNEGSVVLFKSLNVNAIPTGALTIGDGVGGAKADKVIVRNSNQIADANEVVIASSGVLDLQTFAASETVASVSGAGAVDLGSGSVLTVNGATNTTLSGSITGSGVLNRIGSGTLTLSGINDILGTTIGGTSKLLVNGSLGGDVLVQTGGTLAGSGTINGLVTVQSGGIFAPGNSPGSINTGSLDLQAGSTLNIEINGTTLGTDYDSVNVTGAVTLGGALSLSGSYGGTNPPDAFFLVINDGADAISGVFAGINQGDTVVVNGVNYTANYFADINAADPAATGGNDFALVPEPGSATLLIGGLAMLLGRRRRKA